MVTPCVHCGENQPSMMPRSLFHSMSSRNEKWFELPYRNPHSYQISYKPLQGQTIKWSNSYLTVGCLQSDSDLRTVNDYLSSDQIWSDDLEHGLALINGTQNNMPHSLYTAAHQLPFEWMDTLTRRETAPPGVGWGIINRWNCFTAHRLTVGAVNSPNSPH